MTSAGCPYALCPYAKCSLPTERPYYVPSPYGLPKLPGPMGPSLFPAAIRTGVPTAEHEWENDKQWHEQQHVNANRLASEVLYGMALALNTAYGSAGERGHCAIHLADV